MEPVIILYSEPAIASLRLTELYNYLKSKLSKIQIETRPDFISFHLSQLADDQREVALNQLAEDFARAKVRDPMRQHQDFTPLYGEIAYEQRRLDSYQKQTYGLLYDGFLVMQLYHNLLPASERNLSNIHIVFTNQLLGTWEEGDRRYHARVNILGFPNLISTTGVVEAPAKPREYYLLKQQYASLGMDDAMAVALEERFRGRFIQHGDLRLTEVIKGYIMQAIFYQLSGEAFCKDKKCCLFNAHWQHEVLMAQLDSSYEFCPRHKEQLKELVEKL